MGLGIRCGLGQAESSLFYCKMGRKVSFMRGLMFNRNLPQHLEGYSFQCLRKHRIHSAFYSEKWAILTGFLQDLTQDAGFASQADLPQHCLMA